MIWQQTLQKLRPETAERAACLWDAQPKTLKLINNGINAVYYFRTLKENFYLRLTHTKIRSKPALAAAIDYQSHLFTHGAPICAPVLSQQKNYLEAVTQDDLVFLAHVCQAVPGTPMNLIEMTEKTYAAWGAALAKLHSRAITYTPSAEFSFSSWKNLQLETEHYAQTEAIAIQDELAAINVWLCTLKQTSSNFGLTHGDHRDGNVIYDDGSTAHIIDFDEPIYHWFMADIARPFLELGIKNLPLHANYFQAYLSAYQKILPLEETGIADISWFLRMKNLEMYLWTKNNWRGDLQSASLAVRLEQQKQAIYHPEVFKKLFS